MRAVAVFSGPGDASAREVPDLVTVNAGDNGRVDIGSSHLAARRRLQVGTRHRYSNRHRHAALVTKRAHSLDVAPTTNNIFGWPLLIYSFQFRSTFRLHSACVETGFSPISLPLRNQKETFSFRDLNFELYLGFDDTFGPSNLT